MLLYLHRVAISLDIITAYKFSVCSEVEAFSCCGLASEHFKLVRVKKTISIDVVLPEDMHHGGREVVGRRRAVAEVSLPFGEKTRTKVEKESNYQRQSTNHLH